MGAPELPPGRAWADVTADTSGMVPGRSAHGLDGFAVSAWYSDGHHRVRCRCRLIIAEGVVTLSPFEPADGVEEISRRGASVTTERGWAPWSGWRLELNGPVSATVTVPRRYQRQVRDALRAAGVPEMRRR